MPFGASLRVGLGRKSASYVCSAMVLLDGGLSIASPHRRTQTSFACSFCIAGWLSGTDGGKRSSGLSFHVLPCSLA